MGDYETLSQKDTNEILKSKLNEVVFTDPLSEESKKTRRNLLALSLLVIATALYHLEIKTVFNVGFPEKTISSQNIQGIACLAIWYFLIKYIIAVYVDYSGWLHQLRTVETAPFLRLVEVYSVARAETNNRIGRLEAALSSQQQYSSDRFAESAADLKSTHVYLNQMTNGHSHLLASWAKTVETMGKASKRKDWARQFEFWTLEVAIPIGLSVMVLYRSGRNAIPVLQAVWNWL